LDLKEATKLCRLSDLAASFAAQRLPATPRDVSLALLTAQMLGHDP
jgi:hypothetical protein